jgi:hypothetical protein
VYRERQFLRLYRHTRIMGRQHPRRGIEGESQRWLKEIVVYGVRLFRKITEQLQHRWQQKWISILTTLFPKKLSNMSFTNPASTVGLQLLNLWLLKVTLRCVNDGLTTIKPGHQTTWQTERHVWHGQMSRPSRCSLHYEEFMFGEHPRKPTILNAWFHQWNMEEVPWWFEQQYHATIFYWYHYYFYGRITVREYVGSLSNQVHLMNQCYFGTTMQFSKTTVFIYLTIRRYFDQVLKVSWNNQHKIIIICKYNGDDWRNMKCITSWSHMVKEKSMCAEWFFLRKFSNIFSPLISTLKNKLWIRLWK